MKQHHLIAALLLVIAIASAQVGCATKATELPATETPTIAQSPTVTSTATLAATQTPWVITTTSAATPMPEAVELGLLLLSLPDGGYNHLFAFSPGSLSLIRLTGEAWDDITPTLGPDGNWLAYSSRQNGYWDLFLMNLQTGGSLRLTDTRAYDASPSWSPDGSWLAYETYGEQSMEIAILSTTEAGAEPILLTRDTSLDCSPAWSPRGRQVAFVSDRSGEPEIWIADLDHAASDQFINLSRNSMTVESHPGWSPDGTRLAWAAADLETGLSFIWVWDARTPLEPAIQVAAGDWPVWWNDTHIATRISSPNQAYLAAYDSSSGALFLPPMLLSGELQGLGSGLSDVSLPGAFGTIASLVPSPLYQPEMKEAGLPGRKGLVNIPRTLATFPQLSDAADESFKALRARLGLETGWDVLANLENAYVPLSVPLDPGFQQDWLYTGRAFTLSPALIQAGWLVVVREDFGQQTWWRILCPHNRPGWLAGSSSYPCRLGFSHTVRFVPSIRKRR